MTSPKTIRLEFANAIARITLDRRDKLNAFADDMREQLVAALDRVAAMPFPAIAAAARQFE